MTQEITVSIKNNPYIVKFPTVGQFVDIELMKAAISKGQYGSMFISGTKDAGIALDMIDVEAYLSILVGKQLLKDLKVDSFRDLGILDMLEIRQVFVDEILPFINEMRDLIQKVYTNKVENDEK